MRDLGSGAWSVELVRNSQRDATPSCTTAAVGAERRRRIAAASAATTVNNGGVFQVGANVTANEQIQLSISDARITGGTDGAFTALAGIDVTNTAQLRERPDSSSTARSARCRTTGVSSVRSRTASSRPSRTCR